MMFFIISSADMTTTTGVTDHECFNGSFAHAFAASDITNGPGPLKVYTGRADWPVTALDRLAPE